MTDEGMVGVKSLEIKVLK